MEIERKFLVKQLPEHLEQFASKQLEQAYLSTDPVIRVRRSGEEYTLTCKGQGLLAREEFEQPLRPSVYRSLLAKAEGTVISKRRYYIPLDDKTIELDVFDAPLAPLVMAEVEFESVEAAQCFVPPEWFGQEVTEDPAYTNAALSRREARSEEIAVGSYRHFKGMPYEVIGTARHSETLQPMVVYRAMYDDRGLWVRPAEMWNETVEREGKTFLRFAPVQDEN